MKIEPRRTAVLALHFQHDIVSRDGAFGPFFADMVEQTGVVGRTAEVLDAARRADVLIVYARVCFSPGHADVVANGPLFEQVLATGALVRGTPGAEVVPELVPQADDLVVDHLRASPFVGTDLLEQLEARGVDTILLTGVATNVIVEAAAREAANAGLDVYIVADCCTAGEQAAHDASLATMGLLTRGVVASVDVLSALSADASEIVDGAR